MTSRIFIITGQQGIGKTSFCQRLIKIIKSAGWQVAGLLSLAVFENGEKIAIDLVDLRSGQQQRLANLCVGRASCLSTILTFGKWHFETEVLAWGNMVLQTATPCDLLLIDELGPLEFEQRQGWQAGLIALDSGNYNMGIVVIRPELLAEARRRWPSAEVVTVGARHFR